MIDRSIAIDGPSGAGKSTIARMIANKLDYIYVDTGAMYRSIGLFVKRAGADPKNCEAVTALLPQITLDLAYDGRGNQRVLLCGEDVSDYIRTPEMSMYASAVSAHVPVRKFLLRSQQELAVKQNVIMDGRDIGTVVLPGAGLKIYLSASCEARAQRRYDELLLRGEKVTYGDVLEDMKKRDEADSTRAAAPLRPADDAVLVDTTALSLNESVEKIYELVRDRFGTGK